MAEPKTTKATAQGADANAVQTVQNLITERLKMTTNITDERLTGIFRNAKPVKNADFKAFEKIQVGIPNSGVKQDEYFRIIKPGMIEQKIGTEDRRLAIFYIENKAGEQRAIYASGLLRSTPTRSTELNNYDDVKSSNGADLIGFDRGLLANTEGMSFPQLFAKLVGDGTQFVHVTDIVNYEQKGFRLDENGAQNTDPKNGFVSRQSVYALELVAEADVPAE